MSNVKKMIAICLTGMLVLCGITACGGSSESEPEEDTQVEEVVEEEAQEPEEVVEEEEELAEEEPAEEVVEEISDNPLMAAKLQVGDVMNGSNTEKLGEYAWVSVDKATMQNISEEQYAEFAENVVDGSGYNWVTIDMLGGTGIQFAGSMSFISTYGEIDNEKCITKDMGTIMKGENGYEYTEN